ncbi:MAG: hypothetical protein ABUK01_13860 [Leptospirales bacterium]
MSKDKSEQEKLIKEADKRILAIMDADLKRISRRSELHFQLFQRWVEPILFGDNGK